MTPWLPKSVMAVTRWARRSRYPAAFVAIAFLNALCYPLITVGLGYAPHLLFATLRAVLAGLALAVLAALLRRPVPRGWRMWLALAAIGLGSTSLGYLGMFDAAEFVSPGLATIIGNTQPLILAVLAYIFLRERPRPFQRAGLVLGFLGIIVIAMPQLGRTGSVGFAIGFAYIVLATSGVAVGNVLMKALGGRADPLVAMSAQSLFGAVPLAIVALWREQPSTIVWSPAFIASLLGLALFATALGYWLWFALLGRVALSRANSFTFLTPFIGFAIGAAFFGERLSVGVVVGLLLTVVGVVLVETVAWRADRYPAERRGASQY